MMRNLIRATPVIFELMALVSVAHAQTTAAPLSHLPAPAPFLAAGIPALAAIGGGAFVARLVRRWESTPPKVESKSTSTTFVLPMPVAYIWLSLKGVEGSVIRMTDALRGSSGTVFARHSRSSL
jgi:hypothetical protein